MISNDKLVGFSPVAKPRSYVFERIKDMQLFRMVPQKCAVELMQLKRNRAERTENYLFVDAEFFLHLKAPVVVRINTVAKAEAVTNGLGGGLRHG